MHGREQPISKRAGCLFERRHHRLDHFDAGEQVARGYALLAGNGVRIAKCPTACPR
jgi:hypothetical protein